MESTVIKRRSFHITDTAKEWIVFIICLACIALFLSSAYTKIVDHKSFARGLSRVAHIGAYSGIISWLVPLAETAISILLIIPKTYRWGLTSFVGLMAVFTVYITSMLLWAEKLPCHCNLIIQNLSWAQHIWFNLAFIGLAIIALVLSKSNTKS